MKNSPIKLNILMTEGQSLGLMEVDYPYVLTSNLELIMTFHFYIIEMITFDRVHTFLRSPWIWDQVLEKLFSIVYWTLVFWTLMRNNLETLQNNEDIKMHQMQVEMWAKNQRKAIIPEIFNFSVWVVKLYVKTKSDRMIIEQFQF